MVKKQVPYDAAPNGTSEDEMLDSLSLREADAEAAHAEKEEISFDRIQQDKSSYGSPTLQRVISRKEKQRDETIHERPPVTTDAYQAIANIVDDYAVKWQNAHGIRQSCPLFCQGFIYWVVLSLILNLTPFSVSMSTTLIFMNRFKATHDMNVASLEAIIGGGFVGLTLFLIDFLLKYGEMVQYKRNGSFGLFQSPGLLSRKYFILIINVLLFLFLFASTIAIQTECHWNWCMELLKLYEDKK